MQRATPMRHFLRLIAVLLLASLMGGQTFDRAGARTQAPDIGRPAPTARTVTCYTAEADTYASSQFPATNFGTDFLLRVWQEEPASTYVRFDLSDIPQQAPVYSATLKLFQESSEFTTVATQLSGVDEPWEELGLTYETRPDVSGAYDSRTHDDTLGYKSWDATDLVQEWVDGTRSNYGAALFPDDEDVLAQWWSREEGDNVAPQLCVDYDAAPVTNAMFELIPNWGGFDATNVGVAIGVRAIESGGTCGWQPGETVDILWDNPTTPNPLQTFTVDSDGCFKGLFTLFEFSSPIGRHFVTADGTQSGAYQASFDQVLPQLEISPPEGPEGRTVFLDGCNWNPASEVRIFWRPTGDLIKAAAVNPAGTGCISDTLTIPGAGDGIYALVALTDTLSSIPPNTNVYTDSTAAAYWVQSPYLRFEPDNGPPTASLPAFSCNWFPNETVDFVWTSTGDTILSYPADSAGCMTLSGPPQFAVTIPSTATLGGHTVEATGQSSSLSASATVTVREAELNLDPASGGLDTQIDADGCGWVENNQVTIEWGQPDFQGSQPTWTGTVDDQTGCFGPVTFNVPDFSLAETTTLTATGDTLSMATATFDVLHTGSITFPNPDTETGGTIVVDVNNAIVGERLEFVWDNGQVFDVLNANQKDFTGTLDIPIFAEVGQQFINVSGDLGFQDSASLDVQNTATFAVSGGGPFYPDSQINVQGQIWAEHETIDIEMRQGGSWINVGTGFVPDDTQSWFALITIPASFSGGSSADIRATGDKGHSAQTTISLTQPPQPAFTLNAPYADPAPQLDGQLDTGEWDLGTSHSFNNGFLAVQSDDTRLYILLDILGDTTADTLGTQDTFWLSVDIWENGQIDNGWDQNYRLTTDGNADLMLEEYTATGFSSLGDDLKSAVGSGFDCSFADGSLTWDLTNLPLPLDCSSHRVYEVALDLQRISAEPGDAVRLGVRTTSATPSFTEDIPQNFTNDFSRLGKVNLASSRLPGGASSGTINGIGVSNFEIEVTQAVQDQDNGMGLAAGKATIARVYPDVASSATYRVYLSGQRSGDDLPGSPLVATTNIPDSITRGDLDDTANFALPDSWTESGFTELTAEVEALDRHADAANRAAYNTSVFFTTVDEPLIWTMPVNEGTSQNPTLPNQGDIDRQEEEMLTLLPVPDATFIRYGWQEIGAQGSTNMGNALTTIKNWYFGKVLAWLLSGSGNRPYELPNIIYGHRANCDSTPRGCTIGLSDPVWGNGDGWVAVGHAGTNIDSNMAHEVNHNLDRSQSGSWGRHVSNPNTSSSTWGCGASGPDPNWPRMNDDIGEIGFDTREPWTGSTGARTTVIPDNQNEFMSYCANSQEPDKWISEYRWSSLFGYAYESRRPSSLVRAGRTQMTEMLYIVGTINEDDTGQLGPVHLLPGMAMPDPPTGPYSLVVENDAGDDLTTLAFDVSFVDIEGQPRTEVPFDHEIPAPADAARVVLMKDDQVLDTRQASPNLPTITITTPGGGESWSGEQTIQWDASDADSDSLLFTVLYSPDGGGQWTAIANHLDESNYTLETSRLAASDDGRIRVVATDGFNTVQSDSAAFSVADAPPNVRITVPGTRTGLVSNERIELRGSARDATDGQLGDDRLLWSVNGTQVAAGSRASLLLTPGVHTVVLTAVDSNGNVGEASLTINVLGPHHIFLPVLIRDLSN